MMRFVSFTVLVGLRSFCLPFGVGGGTEHIRQGLRWSFGLGLGLAFRGGSGGWVGGLVRCAEVRTSRITERELGVQLESLILAQNERWRQA